jgi:hypothetical protein
VYDLPDHEVERRSGDEGYAYAGVGFLSIFPAESDSGISERTLPSTFSAERDYGMPGSPPKLLSTFSAGSDSGMPRRNAQPPTSCCR